MNNDADETQPIPKDQQNHSPSCSGDCCSHSHISNLEEEYVHLLKELTLNSKEISFLKEFAKCSYLPVSRFIMSSSIEEEAWVESLAPVYINSIDDSMETVKEIRTVLSELEKKRLISLDYDLPCRTMITHSIRNLLFLHSLKKRLMRGRKIQVICLIQQKSSMAASRSLNLESKSLSILRILRISTRLHRGVTGVTVARRF